MALAPLYRWPLKGFIGSARAMGTPEIESCCHGICWNFSASITPLATVSAKACLLGMSHRLVARAGQRLGSGERGFREGAGRARFFGGEGHQQRRGAQVVGL